MQKKETRNPWHYDAVSRGLHWTLALLFIGMLSAGWYMVSIENQPDSRVIFDLHKSFGLITGTLVLLRVLWRIGHKPAPLPDSVPGWQVKAAHLVHFSLYLCIIIMPLAGFLGASFGKHGIAFFGWQLPDWVEKNPDLSELFFTIHGYVAWVLASLIGLHVLAALKHLIIDRDGVFQQMWK